MPPETSIESGPTEFLDHLAEVTERIRRGEDPSPDELRALKAENRRRAEDAEARQADWCDSLPTWLGAIHTTVCNLRCTFCNQAYGKVPEIRMGEDMYRKTVEELYPAAERVQFSTTGEPMMTPHLDRRLIDLERFGCRLEVITNATLFGHDERVARIARVAADMNISMDGGTKETYDELRVGADFDEVVDNIRRYHRIRMLLPPEERGELSFRYIVMKRNLDELPEFVRLISEFEPEKLSVVHLVLFEEEMRGQELGPARELHGRFNEIRARVAEMCEANGIRHDLPPPFPEAPPEPRSNGNAEGAAPADGGPAEPAPAPTSVPCWWPWQRLMVGPGGEMVPCCVPGIFRTGEAQDSTFAEQWNSIYQRELRVRVNSDQPHDICSTCILTHRSPVEGQFDRA